MKHKHAELMALYAQDAMETDEPWERWQYLSTSGRWTDLDHHPIWNQSQCYRRRPRTININGHAVPEPVRHALAERDHYYFVDFGSLFVSNGANDSQWYEASGVSQFRLQSGIIHLTREAAEAHAKALLSFTAKQQ